MTSFASADYGAPSPRLGSMKGRSTRREYWLTIAVLVCAQSVLSVLLPKLGLLSTVAAVVWIRIYTRRLHDLGQSGWRQCLLYAAQAFVLVAGLIWAWPELESLPRAQVTGRETIYSLEPVLLAMVVCFIMQAGYTLWLGLKAGDPEANRFGPPVLAKDVAATFA